MQSVEIVDNFLDSQSFYLISELLSSRQLPYYWHNNIDFENIDNGGFNFGWSHSFCDITKDEYSTYINGLTPFFLKMEHHIGKPIKEILRVRSVVTTSIGTKSVGLFHRDWSDIDDYHVFVWYPFTTDGQFLYREHDGSYEIGVDSVANRCIIMNRPVDHCGSFPIKFPRRISLNVSAKF